MANKYNENSIQQMDPLTFCRHRPDSYLGSNEDSTQLVREIMSNSSDEFLIGNCSEIYIDYDKNNNVVKISDNGQGIVPNIFKEKGQSVLEIVYGNINSSGKYDKSEDAVYKVSTGAFGIGAALTNYLSHWLKATTKRDGEFETVYFSEGLFSKRESGKCDKTEHGVIVEFNPSEDFFRDAKPNFNKLKQEIFNLTCVCKGLKVFLNGEEFFHPEGLKDLVTDRVADNIELTNSRFFFTDTVSDSQGLDFCMAATSRSNCEIVPFGNYSLVESGAPITAVKATLTRCFNNFAREQKLLKDKDKNLDGSSIQEGLVIAFNLVSQQIRYDSQTKVRICSTEDNSYITKVLDQQLTTWLDNNPEDGKNIINQAILAKKASEAAKRAREAVKSKSKEKDKVFKLPTTLADCWGKDRSKCELFLTEGKSAMSGLVAGRDSKFQAVYGVRGKMLSILKVAPGNILKNQEINNIIQALGLDYDPKTAKCVYDKDKLRYDKIIAAADADFDGYAIENLMFNIFWYICPELIINGHIYSSVPPLYRVTTKKNEYIYLKDDNALEEYKSKNMDKIQFLGRMKGLGEQDSDELACCLLEPETRNLYKLTVSDIKKTDKMFKDLYGKNVEPRVKFLEEHLEEARID